MTGNEIRETFLKYFERNGHTRVRSSPLLPANDPTLLFTNAGMNQFKDVFLGLEKRDYVRACSSQKCLRAGGKHNDLDEVGKTARHQTFFEMLGNFSFGDYFKEDAIKFAWDLLVNEFKLEPARMWFSVFEGDDEVGPDEDAERFWEQVGAPRERILRFGREDNFWQMGDTGPCGPCSEIHYYMGPDPSDAENNAANVNGPGDTITEIWNLVFMQFDRSETEPGKYKLTPLPAPSVDTGMGLERITTVLQGVKSNYETDLLKDIVEFIAMLADRKYEADTQGGFAMRVIADHARATAFAIADGILPGNEGRNYVIRKIMRRAIYQGRHALQLENLFFHKVTNFVVDQMKDAYPELEAQRGFIEKMVRLEEERFTQTLVTGLKKFEEDYQEMSSIMTRVSALMWEEFQKPDYDREVTKEKVDALLAENKEKFGIEISHTYDRLAWIAYKHKIPPYLIRARFAASDEVFQGFSPFEASQFGAAIYVLLKKRGTQEEKLLVDWALRENASKEWGDRSNALLSTLDSLFEGTQELEIPNFRNYARLYDTFGTPRDLIRVALEERGVAIEEAHFNESFDSALRSIQTKVIQAAGIPSSESFGVPQLIRMPPSKAQIASAYESVLHRVGVTQFTGYQSVREDAKIVALVFGANDQLEYALAETEVEVVLNRTPFYAESGGQVGDVGRLFGADPPATAGGTDFTATDRSDFAAVVLDTYSPVQGLIVHKVKVEKGKLKVGDTVSAEVDVEKRDATRRNHTATHLMHAALREVLGTHVKQAGSVVAPTYLRFDFTHYQPLTTDEVEEIERLVNYHILRNEPVQTDEMAVEEAMRSGAMALFGEKYGEKVRVLSIKGAGGGEDVFSKELCGGTHVRATGDIGLFKITSDESIASGVRRIRAVTGVDAFERFREAEKILDRVAAGLRTSRTELVGQVERLQDELKKTRREADELRMKIASGAIGSSSNGDESREVAGIRVVAREASGLDSAGMRQLSDTLLARIKSGVVVLGRSSEGKVSLIVRTSPDLIGRVPAGKVIKELAPIVGGKGGGKPDMAEGGGSQPEKLGEALEASYTVVEKLLN